MTADEMMALARELYPICRSITGDGVRATLDLISDHIPLERHEVASGTPVLDWTVPREWNIRDAWIKDASGKRLVDFAASNLHVVNYSAPLPAQRMSLDALEAHLHSLEDRPDVVPYRTTYYDENWGFCLTHRQRESLEAGEYEVCIDSTLEDGALSYGELLIAGESPEEVLISVHVCHPSLANDNLSGIAVATAFAKALRAQPRRLSYRFVFAPGTIGAITWLARNRDAAERVRHGLTLVCIGNDEGLRYKRSLAGDAPIDRAVEAVLESSGELCEVRDFHPYGYDERQYNSPGFRIPMGSLSRGLHGEFPEYHTSADDLSFIQPQRLAGALETLLEIASVLDSNRHFRSLAPFGEPQLGRRGLYCAMGGETNPADLSIALLWTLQLADGEHDLLAVAERSGLDFELVARAAALLEKHDLLEALDHPSGDHAANESKN
jgi:aminopeptidase-like protein